MVHDFPHDGAYKTISVGQLITLLQMLPADARIWPNAVANLLVMSPDRSLSLGFINIGDDTYEAFDEPFVEGSI